MVAAGCTAEPANQTGPSTEVSRAPTSAASTASPTVAASEPSATPTPTPTATPTAKPKKKPHPISVQALIEKSYDGRDLKGGPTDRRRWLVQALPGQSYKGDRERISGVMNVPDGKGPFPVLVLNHGYIDPDIYNPGQGMAREQDFLARRGFVVLHIDYRGHASSTNDPNVDYELRLPYAVDTINAVKAVKSSKLKFLDKDRVGWLGRSMGGNVTLTALVARPGLVDAAVIYASTSSLVADNWRTFSRDAEDERDQPADRPGLRATGGQPGVLASGLVPALLRPDHRADHGPSRAAGRHLSDRVVPAYRAGAAQGRQGRDLSLLPGRGSHLRRTVGAFDRAHRRLLRPRADRLKEPAARARLYRRLSVAYTSSSARAGWPSPSNPSSCREI